MTFFSKPWEHIVVDDFLPIDKFEELKKVSYSIETNDDIGREFLDHDPLNIDHMFKLFSNPKRYTGGLDKLIHLSAIRSNLMHHMHVDANFKIMTAILYLGPEESMGTRLFDKDKNFVKEVEWKPNRLLVFCSNDDTWHSFGSYENERHTLNYFLIASNEHISNDIFRSNVIKNGGFTS